MSRFLRFLAFFCLVFSLPDFKCDAVAFPPSYRGQAEALYNWNGEPSTHLLNLLDTFNVHTDGTWESIFTSTQAQWLQKQGQERWNYPAVIDPNPEATYRLFSQLGMTQPFYASCSDYAYGVVLGGTVERVRSRLAFLKSEWERGVRFKTLVFLTGDRPLDPSVEGEATLLNSPYPNDPNWKRKGKFPRNETEMMQYIFEQMELPQEWRSLPFVIVDTPKPVGKARPNTQDTFEAWMKLNPTPGNVLAVSTQPFIGRQDTVGRQELMDGFYLQTIGPGFSFEEYTQHPRGLSILLDELARWIAQLRSSYK